MREPAWVIDGDVVENGRSIPDGVLRRRSKSEIRRATIQTRRSALVQRLGGACEAACDWEVCSPDLQFDHKNGRDYDLRALDQYTRIRLYEEEAEQGLIQILCGYHNRVKGGRKKHAY